MASNKQSWSDVVVLMRADLPSMGNEPANAARFALRVAAGYDALLAQYRRAMKLSGSELQALLTLWDSGRMSMTDLGLRIGLSRAAVTTLADRLEFIEMIERVPDPGDRRRILVAVTLKADEALMTTAAEMQKRLSATATDNPAAWNSYALAASSVRETVKAEAERMSAVDYEGRPPRAKRKADLDGNDSW